MTGISLSNILLQESIGINCHENTLNIVFCKRGQASDKETNKTRNTTQTAVINIFKIRILLNLTFRMFVQIHFQKYNRYGFGKLFILQQLGSGT